MLIVLGQKVPAATVDFLYGPGDRGRSRQPCLPLLLTNGEYSSS